MIARLLHRTLFILVTGLTFFLASCNDDDKPKIIPELTTAPVTDITPTTASSGGEIISDGNAEITVSGICWSSTNTTPTTADSKTELDVTSGSFTSLMEGLSSGTTYHVRAYATNSVGTGYGDVVTFATANGAPTATNVLISGTARVPEILTATYTYNDAENDVESGSTFQWYTANDGAGTGETAIAGATLLTYTLKPTDEFKFIRFGVTPKSTTGNTTGAEVKSAFVGPIEEEPTTLTFPYNGQTVTYGIIISPVTGRRWLDRNLGAPATPTAWDDYANYGDAFQWGRGADGHQLLNRGATGGTTTSVNGTTTTLSTGDTPGHSLFILYSSDAGDWRSTQNDNLWQGVNGINNPCPTGWRIPTITELQAENFSNLADAYTKLKFTAGGYRELEEGTIVLANSFGRYWSSTLKPFLPLTPSGVAPLDITTTDIQPVLGTYRGNAMMCRCIRD